MTINVSRACAANNRFSLFGLIMKTEPEDLRGGTPGDNKDYVINSKCKNKAKRPDTHTFFKKCLVHFIAITHALLCLRRPNLKIGIHGDIKVPDHNSYSSHIWCLLASLAHGFLLLRRDMDL